MTERVSTTLKIKADKFNDMDEVRELVVPGLVDERPGSLFN